MQNLKKYWRKNAIGIGLINRNIPTINTTNYDFIYVHRSFQNPIKVNEIKCIFLMRNTYPLSRSLASTSN